MQSVISTHGALRLTVRRTGNGPGSSGHIFMHKLDGLSLVEIYGTLTYNTVGVYFGVSQREL